MFQSASILGEQGHQLSIVLFFKQQIKEGFANHKRIFNFVSNARREVPNLANRSSCCRFFSSSGLKCCKITVTGLDDLPVPDGRTLIRRSGVFLAASDRFIFWSSNAWPPSRALSISFLGRFQASLRESQEHWITAGGAAQPACKPTACPVR